MELQLPDNIKLIKLSPEKEITIYMIREELKGRCLFNGLANIGFDTSTCFDLSPLVLSFAGFEERNDELYNWYFSLLDKHVEGMDINDRPSLNDKAFEIYMELADRRKKS